MVLLELTVWYITGPLLFTGLFFWDQKQADVRVQQRATLRKAQIQFGDRWALFCSLTALHSALLNGAIDTEC